MYLKKKIRKLLILEKYLEGKKNHQKKKKNYNYKNYTFLFKNNNINNNPLSK